MFLEARDLRSSRWLTEGSGEEAAELLAEDGGELTAGV